MKNVFVFLSNLAMLFPMTQPLVKILKYNKALWETSRKVFRKYIENGIEGMNVLLDPNFETEVFYSHFKDSNECESATCNF